MSDCTESFLDSRSSFLRFLFQLFDEIFLLANPVERERSLSDKDLLIELFQLIILYFFEVLILFSFASFLKLLFISNHVRPKEISATSM